MVHIKINGFDYKFNVIYSFIKKQKDSNGSIECVLQIQVWKENKQILWRDIKDTYAGEVIARTIMDIINEE